MGRGEIFPDGEVSIKVHFFMERKPRCPYTGIAYKKGTGYLGILNTDMLVYDTAMSPYERKWQNAEMGYIADPRRGAQSHFQTKRSRSAGQVVTAVNNRQAKRRKVRRKRRIAPKKRRSFYSLRNMARGYYKPRRGRYRRRGGYRKRRVYKRKGKRSFSQRVTRVVMQQLSAPKIWKSEDVVGEIVAPGQCHWWIPYTNGSTVDLSAALVDTGEASLQLGSGWASADHWMKNVSTKATVRNLSEHPCHITVYWCKLKKDVEDNVHAGVKTTALNYLMLGWKDRMNDADEVKDQLAVSGDALVTDMFNMTPYSSTPFLESYKIVKKTTGVFPPGAVMDVSIGWRGLKKVTNFNIDGAREDAIKPFTMFPLIKFYGTLGREIASPHTAVNTLQCHLGCIFFKTINFTYQDPHKPLIATTDNKPAPVSVEGPSDYKMEEDD